MDLFYKSICLALAAALLSVMLGQQKNFAVLVSLAAAAMVIYAATILLRPVIDFLVSLERIGNIPGESLTRMLRVLAVGYTAEIVGGICTDAGNASLTKAVQITASVMILYISVPMFTRLLELLEALLSRI